MEAGGDPRKANQIAQRRAKKNKKKHNKKDTDVAVKTSWFDNYFEDYADAMREGNTDALDILIAKADKEDRKTSGYDPLKYTGTYVATATSQGTVDALRCFQSQVKIGMDRQGRLYLRRAGVAGGPDCGAGPWHRGLSDWAF